MAAYEYPVNTIVRVQSLVPDPRSSVASDRYPCRLIFQSWHKSLPPNCYLSQPDAHLCGVPMSRTVRQTIMGFVREMIAVRSWHKNFRFARCTNPRTRRVRNPLNLHSPSSRRCQVCLFCLITKDSPCGPQQLGYKSFGGLFLLVELLAFLLRLTTRWIDCRASPLPQAAGSSPSGTASSSIVCQASSGTLSNYGQHPRLPSANTTRFTTIPLDNQSQRRS